MLKRTPPRLYDGFSAMSRAPKQLESQSSHSASAHLREAVEAQFKQGVRTIGERQKEYQDKSHDLSAILEERDSVRRQLAEVRRQRALLTGRDEWMRRREWAHARLRPDGGSQDSAGGAGNSAGNSGNVDGGENRKHQPQGEKRRRGSEKGQFPREQLKEQQKSEHSGVEPSDDLSTVADMDQDEGPEDGPVEHEATQEWECASSNALPDGASPVYASDASSSMSPELAVQKKSPRLSRQRAAAELSTSLEY